MSKIRKWSDSYVSFCFTKVSRDGQECAQCLYFSVVMVNPSLRPSKLQNHRDKKHLERSNDNDVLSAKNAQFDREGTLPHFGFSTERNLLFNAATRWRIDLQSVGSRKLSLRNLSSHVQRK